MNLNLELRKAVCEALGWKRDRDGDGWWHSPKCVTDQSGHRDYAPPDKCHYPSHVAEENLPAIESDPAISEAELEKLCKERNGYWTVQYNTLFRSSREEPLRVLVVY